MTDSIQGERVSVEVWSVEKTGQSEHGTDVLEVKLMIERPDGGRRSFTGIAHHDRVELESDPDDLNLHPDELKELISGAAHEWDKQFDDWDATILSREEPVSR